MITFNVNDLREVEYTFSLTGNDGEEQLNLTRSWGQDSCSDLVIVSASVDDHVKVLYASTEPLDPGTWIKQVEATVRAWCCRGIAPTAEQQTAQDTEVKKLIALIARLDGIDRNITRYTKMKQKTN